MCAVMRRRAGRPSKDEGSKKSAHLSIRISAKLRDLLEKARRRSGGEVSLSEEVELRLIASFQADKEVEERFGGYPTAGLLAIVAKCIRAIEIRCDGDHWLDNAFVFGQARQMLNVLLDHFRPRGKRVIPKLHPSLGKYAKEIGPYEARRALALLEQAKNASRQEIENIPVELRPVEYLQVKNVLGRLLQRKPTDELQAYEEQRRRRIDAYWESRGTTAEAQRRRVDALTERRMTASALVGFLKPKLVEGTKISISKVFKDVTGANLAQQKVAIIERIKAETKGKLTDPATNLESDLGRLLDAAAKRETSAEGISDKQHRNIQRRDEEAHEEAERFLKEAGQKAERRPIQKGERR
jgi:hypothetical protein